MGVRAELQGLRLPLGGVQAVLRLRLRWRAPRRLPLHRARAPRAGHGPRRAARQRRGVLPAARALVHRVLLPRAGRRDLRARPQARALLRPAHGAVELRGGARGRVHVRRDARVVPARRVPAGREAAARAASAAQAADVRRRARERAGRLCVYSVVTARSTSTRAARRAGGIAATTPATPARMKNAISDPIGSTNTNPWSASGRETISENTTPSTVPRTAPMPAVITDSQVTTQRTWLLLMPTARSIPSSRVRSWIESASVLTMPSSATITDSASSANTSPSSELIESDCFFLNCSIDSASADGYFLSAWSAAAASLSSSVPGAAEAVTKAMFLASQAVLSVLLVRMMFEVRPAWFLKIPAT